MVRALCKLVRKSDHYCASFVFLNTSYQNFGEHSDGESRKYNIFISV